jgi:hypothetical protein
VSLRQKYLKILSEIIPAGTVGVSLLLGSAAPGNANQHSAAWQPSASASSNVSERLAAIRDAVSDIAETAGGPAKGEQQLAWGNWWRNGGWRRPGWRNGGWGNWRNGWRNGGWHNWWHNW